MVVELRRERLLESGEEISGGWRVGEVLAEGGFGQIFLASKGDESQAAVKAEEKVGLGLLKIERTVYSDSQRLPRPNHFLALLGEGATPKAELLVLELAGLNLARIKRSMGDTGMREGTTLKLGLEMLCGLEELHWLGWLHRDVKPSNFCLRRGSTFAVALLDFGLARRYLDGSGEHKSRRQGCGFRGTLRYASPNVHNGLDMSRRDDLISLLYILGEQMLGFLPWRRILHKPTVLGYKMEWAEAWQEWASVSPLLSILYHHIKDLDFSDTPDYANLRKAFNRRLGELPRERSHEWHSSLHHLHLPTLSHSHSHDH